MEISDEHRELIASLQGVEVPDILCLMCEPTLVGKDITHADGCPVSADVDAVTARDRLWFDTHPAADFFYREVTWGEAAQLIVVSPIMKAPLPPSSSLSTAGRVRVERLTDGVRLRRFDDVYFVIGPDDEART